MASPQLEDGHTRIANETLEHLAKIHLSSNQWQVLLCIIRKTYGFHKKVDYIANFQIAEATGLCKAVVSRVLEKLTELNMIDRKGKFIGFQKDWEQWQKLTISSTKVSSLANNEKLAIQSTLDSKLAVQSTPEKLAILTSKLAVQSTKVSSSPAHVDSRAQQKIKDIIQKKEVSKLTYGEFQNILLTEKELEKLHDKFGVVADEMIETMSRTFQSKGIKYAKQYVDHYATIVNWIKRDEKPIQQSSLPAKKPPLSRVPEHYLTPDEIIKKGLEDDARREKEYEGRI